MRAVDKKLSAYIYDEIFQSLSEESKQSLRSIINSLEQIKRDFNIPFNIEKLIKSIFLNHCN